MIHSICCLNRFTGQAKHPYSVGQHTRNLMFSVPLSLRRAALVHDFGESWFNDLASPVKAEIPTYKFFENEAKLCIGYELGVTEAEFAELDIYDKRIYKNERDALFDVIGERSMGDQYEPLPHNELHDFEERPWRSVRADLEHWFKFYFREESNRYV